MLCLHGARFYSPQSSHQLSADGDSHLFDLALPKYKKTAPGYDFTQLRSDLNYTVLIDNGIDDESTHYRDTFPHARIIKLCYDDGTWPIVARTWVEKAMKIQFDQAVDIDHDRWPTREDWAVREKYFLYLRDHELRHRWRPDRDCHNIAIRSLLQYSTMVQSLTDFGMTDSFREDWSRWFDANAKYIAPVLRAQQLLDDPDAAQDLRNLTLWEQAVINYHVWLRYGIEIPANDYSDWFAHSDQLHHAITQLRGLTNT